MTIGTASRLFGLRALYRHDSGISGRSGQFSVSEAYWSVYILERLFLPFSRELSAVDAPAYPDSAPVPPPPLHPTVNTPTTNHRADSNWGTPTVTSDIPGKDLGVAGQSIAMVTIWGHMRSYLHQLRRGDVEKPWLPESVYMKLSMELMELEAQPRREHLLQNVALADRTPAETSQQLEYWHPWVAGQLIWHAAYAILNHPFLHLVVMRPREGFSQSCFFLQQRVETAIYHIGWLHRIIQLSQDRVEIVHPIVADAIGAAATVPWLFQFAKDPKVAQRAQEALVTCQTLLSRIVLMWPHVSQKLAILKRLELLANENRQEMANKDEIVSFKSAWFWELLDPTIGQHGEDSTPDLAYDHRRGSDHDTTMYCRTQFVDPLREDEDNGLVQEQPPDSMTLASTNVDLFANPGNLEQFNIDELSHDFLQNSTWNF
ncbi:hypothetical protein LRP88_04345 [Fusarium phalaenopsidis]